MSTDKLVQNVINAYAHDPEGLTLKECTDLTESPEQADALCFVLGKAGAGEITESNRADLETAGFSAEFIRGIAGTDGTRSIRERAKWLGDHAVTKLGRRDFNNEMREEFVRELGHMGHVFIRQLGPEGLSLVAESAVSALRVQMRRGNPEAAISLAWADNTAKDAEPYLIKALKHEDFGIRWKAAGALGDIRPVTKAAVPALIEALKDHNIGWTVFYALGKIGSAAKDAVPALIDALTCGNGEVYRDFIDEDRIYAAEALGRIGPAAKAAVPALIDALEDEDSDTRREAANALSKIDPAAKDVVKYAIPVLIAWVKDDGGGVFDIEYAQRGDVAFEVLGRIGPAAKAAVPALIDALKYGDGSGHEYVNIVGKKFRQYAAETLGRIGPEARAAVPALTEALKDESECIRQAAAEALEKIRG